MSAKRKFEIHAELRDVQGKGASRRLRRTENKFPAIVYGGGEAPTNIMLDHQKMMHAIEHEGFFSHLLTLFLEGKKQQVVLQDIQRHHYKKAILHMDLMRVQPTDVIHMKVPLHFLGGAEAPGVVDSGGIVNHRMMDLDVKCQAKDLPEFIEIDISKMVLDQTLHISDLKIPKNVESVALSHGKDHDHPVVSIHLARVVLEETPVETEAVEGEGEAEGAEAGKETAGKEAAAKGSAPAAKDNKDQKKEAGKGSEKAKGK